MLNGFSHLRTLKLVDNPLSCDCHLAWLSRHLKTYPRLGQHTRCSSPIHLKDRNIADLQVRSTSDVPFRSACLWVDTEDTPEKRTDRIVVKIFFFFRRDFSKSRFYFDLCRVLKSSFPCANRSTSSNVPGRSSAQDQSVARNRSARILADAPTVLSTAERILWRKCPPISRRTPQNCSYTLLCHELTA